MKGNLRWQIKKEDTKSLAPFSFFPLKYDTACYKHVITRLSVILWLRFFWSRFLILYINANTDIACYWHVIGNLVFSTFHVIKVEIFILYAGYCNYYKRLNLAVQLTRGKKVDESLSTCAGVGWRSSRAFHVIQMIRSGRM